MTVTAPKEIQGLPSGGENAQIVHLPEQEEDWRRRVTKEAQKIVPTHTTEQAIPPATQGIIEFPTVTDVRRNIGDIFKEEGLGAHVVVGRGKEPASGIIARAKRMIGLKKAA